VEWIAKWQKQSALMPQAKAPLDPNINPRIYNSRYAIRQDANVPVQGEYPSIALIDHWLPYQFLKTVKYEGDFETLQNEYLTKIINGEKPVADGIKEFWSKWRAAGGDARIQEQTDQFNKWIKDHPEWKDPKASLAAEVWNTKREYPPPVKP
jgi:hypothetical protein